MLGIDEQKLSNFFAFFDYFDKNVIVLSATKVSVVSFACVIETPVRTASASFSFAFL